VRERGERGAREKREERKRDKREKLFIIAVGVRLTSFLLLL
jgi:hypothetical protein